MNFFGRKNPWGFNPLEIHEGDMVEQEVNGLARFRCSLARWLCFHQMKNLRTKLLESCNNFSPFMYLYRFTDLEGCDWVVAVLPDEAYLHIDNASFQRHHHDE